jgi:hypothetical protein
MAHDGSRLVPRAPACGLETAQQVDVLTDAEVRIEPPDLFESGEAADEHRRRHVGHPAVSTDNRRVRTEIERRMCPVVFAEHGAPAPCGLALRGAPCSLTPRSLGGDNAGGHRPDSGIVEMPDQLVEEVRAGNHIGVDESDKARTRSSDEGAGGVPRHRRAAGLGPPDEAATSLPDDLGNDTWVS